VAGCRHWKRQWLAAIWLHLACGTPASAALQGALGDTGLFRQASSCKRASSLIRR